MTTLELLSLMRLLSAMESAMLASKIVFPDYLSDEVTRHTEILEREILERSKPYEITRAIEAEVRKQDEALILQLVEALEQSHATLFEEDDDPERPAHAAIAAARARLLEADLAKLTERGAVAWKGIDPQDLRDGGKP